MGCPPEKLRLNRTGIPLDDYPFAPREIPADGAWQFVQACRLIAKKGLKTAFQAFARFHANHPRARASRWRGRGRCRPELGRLARELGIGHAVDFRGFLSQPDLAKLYAHSHVFVHPSEMTAPTKIRKASRIRCSRRWPRGFPSWPPGTAGFRRRWRDGQPPDLLVSEKDPDALLSAAMRRLTELPAFYRSCGDAAARSVREEFSHERAIERLESFYDEAREPGRTTRKAAVTPDQLDLRPATSRGIPPERDASAAR